jgi:DNA-binding transcriptional LysR family regulator
MDALAQGGEPTLDARYAQLRLRDLLLLEHIAELGSLRAAAERLHVTQSAVSQALAGLESAFGTTLVERGRRGQRGVRLTAAGVAAQARLRAARHELLAAREAARTPARVALRLGVLPLASLEMVPEALARLRTQLPGLEVNLVEGTVTVLWSLLARGEVDAVIGRMPVLTESNPMPPGIAHWRIGTERLVLCAARLHPVARRRAPDLAQLREYDWVAPPTGSLTRLAFDQLFVRAGLIPPRPVVTSLSFHANLHLAGRAGLLAVAPELAVRSYTQSLDLKVLAAPWAESDADVVLACREAGLAQPAMAALLDCFEVQRPARRRVSR